MHESKPGRTFELWVLALLFLLSAGFGFQRLGVTIYAWGTLEKLGMQPGPVYTALTGALWGLASLAAGGGLLLRRRWAPRFAREASLALAALYWVDRLALTRSPDAQASLGFAAIVTAFLLAFTFSVLALERQKRFFESD